MQSRPLRLFYFSSALGTLAHAMFVYGLVVLVTDRTHSSALASLTYFMAFAFMAAMTPARALTADRRPKIPILMYCQLAMAGSTGLLALVVLGMPSPSLLNIGAVVFSATYGYSSGGIAGTRMALLPQLTPKLATPTMVVQMMTIVGFSLGPVCYAEIRVRGGDAVAMAGVTILLIASALTLPRIVEVVPLKPASGHGVWHGIKDAVRHFREVPLLWHSLLLGTIPALLVLGPVQAVLPRLLSNAFPGDELFRGAFFSMMGIGLFLGAAVSLAYVGRSPYRKLLAGLIGMAACGALAAMPYVDGKFAVGGLALLCGIGLGVPSTVVPVLLQEGSGTEFRSRVMNTNALRVTLVPAVGAVLCGTLADATSMQLALCAFGLLGVVASCASLFAIYRPRSDQASDCGRC